MGSMSEVRRVVAQALHDTRDGGTAVLTDSGGGSGVVQWICFGADGHHVEVPDPARHRPGGLRRLLRRSGPDPVGLDDDRIRALERLGFTPSGSGYELPVGPGTLGHDQLVHVIVGALDVVGIDGSRLTVEVF